jgi:hypothetical protein
MGAIVFAFGSQEAEDDFGLVGFQSRNVLYEGHQRTTMPPR